MANSSATISAAPTIPQVVQPLVLPDGTITQPWLRLLISLVTKTGAGVNAPTTVFLTSVANGVISAFSAGTNGLIGTLFTDSQFLAKVGLPARELAPAISPFVYAAVSRGSLVVESGQVEFSRDNGVTWYIAGLTGGMIPMLNKDQVRVTWYNAIPKITWMGD